MSVQVVPVTTSGERDQFLKLPQRLYRDVKNWTPNLLLLQREQLSPKHNPFFEEGEAQLFLARREGRVVGRVSAQIDHRHIERYNEKRGFFGFYEVEDDREVSDALLAAAEGWLRERGMEGIRGPLSFCMDEDVGLMFEGFDSPAVVGNPQHLPYYQALIESYGFEKAMDTYAWRWELKEPPERMQDAISRTRAAPGLTMRNVSLLHLQRDVDIMLDIYSQAWSDNWGYVPLTRSAANKIASDLRLIADPSIALMAEIDGEPAGFVVAVPNLYETIGDFKGFLNPWNAAKLVWRLKVRGPVSGRVVLFGVKPKFRHRRDLVGLPFLLLDDLYRAATKKRYKWCDESWILEDNKAMNSLLPYWDCYIHKRFRIYDKSLTTPSSEGA